MNDISEILSVIGTIVLMIVVFTAAYFASKYVGKHYRPHCGFSKHITVVDSTYVGKDRALLLVKVGEKAFLVGSTPNELTLLSEIDAGQFAAESIAEEPLRTDFISVFRDAIRGRIK